MRRIFVFNPCTNYALAFDSEGFTPSAPVIGVRRRFALLPSLFASRGDIILTLDNFTARELTQLQYYDVCLKKGLLIIGMNDKQLFKELYSEGEIKPEPWGWDKRIRRHFLDLGFTLSDLPDFNYLDSLKELSHRRTTIPMLRYLTQGKDTEIEIPQEIFTPEETVEAFRSDSNIFLKAPWSSSGRGILACGRKNEAQVRSWASGIISRQGSVLIEKGYSKTLDFATEWLCTNGEVKFIGFSVFKATADGKYQNNIRADQQTLKEMISTHTHEDIDENVMRQSNALRYLIAPGYEGPLGIDMLATENGCINPCVEINLRHTMGMLELLRYED